MTDYLTHGLLIVSLIGAVHIQAPVQAENVTVTSPNGGHCLLGGSTTSITWTASSGVNHVGIAYRSDGSQPAVWTSSPSSYFAHPISGTSYAWTVPSETTQTVKIWLDGHNVSHSSLAMDGSDASFSIDSSPPTAPALSSTDTTSSSISLSFTASSDTGCEGLSGYKVFRNNQEISTLSASTTTYTDTNLSPATSYTYRIQAYDDFATSTSNELSVTTDTATSSPTPASSTSSPSPSSTVSPSTSPTTTPSISSTSSASAASSPSAKPSISIAPTNQTTVVTHVFIKRDAIFQELPLTDIAMLSSGQNLVFEGIGEVGKTLVGTIAQTSIERDTTIGPNGTWQIELDPGALTDGEYQIVLAEKASDGTLNNKQTIFAFIYQTDNALIAEVTDVITAQTTGATTHNSSIVWSILFLIMLFFSSYVLFRFVRNKRTPTSSPSATQ